MKRLKKTNKKVNKQILKISKTQMKIKFKNKRK